MSIPSFKLPGINEALPLKLLTEDDEYQSYLGELQTLDERVLATLNEFQINFEGINRVITIIVPPNTLAIGHYRIKLYGINSDNEKLFLGERLFRIVDR
jgi:hypothetical protein